MKEFLQSLGILILFFIGSAFIIWIFLGDKGLAKNIAKCQQVTNYSAERCEWELTK